MRRYTLYVRRYAGNFHQRPRDQVPALPIGTGNRNRQGQPLPSLRPLQGKESHPLIVREKRSYQLIMTMSDPVNASSLPTTHPPASSGAPELTPAVAGTSAAGAGTSAAGASGSTTTTGGQSTGANALASLLDTVRATVREEIRTVREEICRHLPPASARPGTGFPKAR